MDKEQAEELLEKLPGIEPALIEPLLLSFARKIGSASPDAFLVQELSEQTTQLRAAVGRPPSAELKGKFVERGPGREDVLADVALVFTQSRKAKWTRRAHGHKGGPKPPGEPLFQEWVWEGSDPPVVKHGAVRVDASGTVVQILSVPDHIEGGRAKLIELMKKAGWTLAKDLA
jgi:hypothetical protein